MYYKACTKHFPVLLCITKLAQSTSQYYFVLESLHEVRPSTTLYYKACTKYVPVLLCTTKPAQVLSSATLNYKACEKYVPVLLCDTKLAQSTSQYSLVLQSLHKARPSTTLYYKACTKYKTCTRHMPTGLNDLLRHVPTGLNDLWATENVKGRNSEFLYETSFDYVHMTINK